ncbi:peptidase M28 [Hyphomicrobium methylovorum]|uniref:DUF4910 domain-containing protein n=1 Tax=Hyphomicrobium methylovorum TaxID=84 RepID=UPI0015E7AE47|nr:DUF4910 domain-containing protein [Hyphomicrobium methylovorum]MBA2127603.1 peptidase M28 [Hyphomicrobium methylovorum]
MTSQTVSGFDLLAADDVANAAVGDEIYSLAAEIFPICRSITGNGVRQTLDILRQHIDLEVHEVPTGTKVFDWTIPREWNIREAYIRAPSGERVVDFQRSSLHVLNYSKPVRARMPLQELKEHIYTLPEQPDAVPYRTAYGGDRWGFCMAHNQFLALEDGTYEVAIESSLEEGSLTYGEAFLRGATEDEVLLTTHICHPSLANDNCSGLALLTALIKRLAKQKTRYSYRFLFGPGSLGAISWLSRNRATASRVKHGIVLSCVGDGGGPTYKKSRIGDAFIDRAFTHVLKHASRKPNILDFIPYGYDERQFCSPGFNLPVGLFQRSQFGTFPEYHCSDDNLDFIKPEHLASSFEMVASVLSVIENEKRYVSNNPFCEPQLGRRGLYGSVGGEKSVADRNMARLWVMNLCDGSHSLLDIAERSGIPFSIIADVARELAEHDLLSEGSEMSR